MRQAIRASIAPLEPVTSEWDFPVTVVKPVQILFGVGGKIVGPENGAKGGWTLPIGEKHTGRGYLKFAPGFTGYTWHGFRVTTPTRLTRLDWIVQWHVFSLDPHWRVPGAWVGPEIGLTIETNRGDWIAAQGGKQLVYPMEPQDGPHIGTVAPKGIVLAPGDNVYMTLMGVHGTPWWCYLEAYGAACLEPA